MRLWFDTEFIEDGKTIDLISIGVVREDGQMLYATNIECNKESACDWVKENVLPHVDVVPSFNGNTTVKLNATSKEIASSMVEFCGEKPEIWAYYADYDWVVLCQLFGTMMDLPDGWPMYCRDVKQLCDYFGNPKLPKQEKHQHNALADAVWTRNAWHFLMQKQAKNRKHVLVE
ncbi:MAG: 3'-5' exoribonuclease [Desulfocapsa sp.]|nr:MAG: 3'-5' exoribonuclease [Desulfocapsa sp.]